jgi:hypothetical protein
MDLESGDMHLNYEKRTSGEDLMRLYSQENNHLYDLAEINETLKKYGLNLRKLKLPSVEMHATPLNSQSFDLEKEIQNNYKYTKYLSNENKKINTGAYFLKTRNVKPPGIAVNDYRLRKQARFHGNN